MSELLKEKKKTSELASEATLEKVSNKTLDIMGPLSKLWLEVEKVTSHEGDEEPPCLSIETAQSLIEKTVSLVGQLHNFITYERKKNVMGAVANSNNASSSLKDNVEILSKEEDGSFCWT